LEDNAVSDVSPLSSLMDLRGLSLRGNSLSDISSLSGLTTLHTLYLGNNSISDISPLAAISEKVEFVRVGLVDNPLNATAYDTHIPALRARRWDVHLDFSPR